MNTFSYSQYSIISEADRVITFGGHCHYQAPFELDEVTEYKNDEWTLLGTEFKGYMTSFSIDLKVDVLLKFGIKS